MNKLRTFRLHWTAEIRGVQTVQAFDENDAEEQFDSIIHEDAIPDEPIYVTLEEVEDTKRVVK